jgi:outer membrane protein assembly factor BamB
MMKRVTVARRAARTVLASVCIASFALIAGCGDKDVEKPAELVDFQTTRKVDRLWSIGLGGAEHLRLALRPTVVDDVVYTASHKGEVIALSANNGRRLWQTKTKLALSAGPEVADGMVVVGSSDGDVVALSAENGAELWRQSIAAEILARPLVVNDVVIVRTVNGRLEALSRTDGAVRWSLDESVPRLTLRGTAPPVLAGDRIIAGFDNGRVLAVDPRSGEVLWDTVVNAPSGRTELERLADIDAPPRVSGSDVFVVGFQGRMAMLALDSGQIWWARDASSYRGFAMDATALYLSNADGAVVAMRRTDGAVLWEQDALTRRGITAPAIDGDAIVVADFEGFVHWLDKSTGEFVARHKTDGERVTNAPVATDAGVFVQTDAGRLVAFKSRAPQPAVADANEASRAR